MERVISVPNETEASYSRNTCDGRKLTYKLKVLQQPERARACGSGAKSSADRRPVDPPPIVELRIFEGEKADNDITFSVNANYFLFATLEQARPIAQGRVPNDPTKLTVLTGSPVAGMVYLDRPEPAGYFIFSDLSVRHEGKYRLGFSLYEELKDPKDADQLDDASAAAQGEAQITHRLEVKSQPFVVFSAKKFPGLASSTQLSRTVADQGCRVRIRREVRMRRREKEKDYDGYSEQGRHSKTPDVYQHNMAAAHAAVDPTNRERSDSNASHVSLAAAPPARRTSGHEMIQPYPQPSYAPQPPAQPPIVQPAHPAQPQYPQPSTHQYAPQYVQQQPHMQPPQMQPPQHQMHYPQYQYPQTAAPAAPTHQHPYYGYAQPVQQHPQYEEATSARNMSIDYTHTAPVSADVRRPSLVQAPVYSHNGQPQAYSSQYPQASAYTPQQTPKMRQLSQVSTSSASGVAPQILPPINTSLVPQTKLEVSPPSSAVSQTHYYDTNRSNEAGQMNGKRSYDRVFDTRHLNGPLRQGARPSVSYTNLLADEGSHSDLAELEGLKMSYRRADGREIARPLPPSHD